MGTWVWAAVAVAVLTAGCATSGPAAAPTPAPAPAGTGWQLTHTVDLPSRWRTGMRSVTAYGSTSVVNGDGYLLAREPGGTGQRTSCEVTVQQPGHPLDVPAAAEDVDVGGRPGRFVATDPQHVERPSGLWWTAADGTSAHVACEADAATTTALATRVRLALDPVRVPLRLTRLPDGYHAAGINVAADGGSLSLAPDRPGSQPYLLAYVTDRAVVAEADDERITVAGRDAVLQPAVRRICLTETRLCVGEDAVDFMGEPKELPAGYRDLLLAGAAALQPGSFSGAEAFPA